MTKRTTYKTIAIPAAFGVLFVLVLCIMIWWEHIAIHYHKQRVKALLNKKPKYDPDSGLSYFEEDWVQALEKHRDKLVKLGHLQRREFPLSTIKSPSLQFRRLWEELGTIFPENPYAEGHGYDSNNPATIVVYDQPQKLPKWERIILAHDAPSTNIVKVDEQVDSQDLLAFVGHWAYDEGEVCYIISKDSEGSVRIEEPPNEAWRTVLRNVRFDGKRIMFDKFNYIDPNEDYKTIINPYADDPLSGVRYETVFELNPKDSNELLETTSVVHKYGIISDPNKGILRKLK
ncbi:MAG: hypothetical protein GWN67_14855 [Phycisphaerae bacterium]|nr:hypothetical protein [Phycisphaerae bacterium]NIP52843.1 hypothetical protein [Phycisphaerae bacterium]NIS51864.1 hypothetical protein [Phycisphaerae bacterium]NIU09382.1 hypothetical protein [Phycisphaerae bacterium]NIU57615.1 hypothetical protein [Phycisphaerae bacterium]